MSLNAHEERVLASIGGGLAGSDPKLAALLDTFARLTAGEEMPAREKLRAGWRWAAGRSRRRPGKLVWPLVWLVISLSMVAIALAVGLTTSSAGQGGCAISVAACAGPAHKASP